MASTEVSLGPKAECASCSHRHHDLNGLTVSVDASEPRAIAFLLMTEPKVLKAILILLSVPLLVFGGWRLVDPAGFYRFSGMTLPEVAGMWSEIRGAGGVIAVSGIIVLLGAFRPRWTFTATVLAAVVFLSLAFGRGLGVILDGAPNREVVQGAVIELVFGLLALFAYFKYQRNGRQAK